MERLTGNDAKFMMEALASVYTKEEVEQEVISEEVLGTDLVLENDEYEKLDENLLQLLTRNRTVYRRDPDTGEKIKVQQQRDPKNLDKYIDKNTSGTGDYGYRDKKPGEAGDGTMGNFVRRTGPKTDTAPAASTSMADKKPAKDPNVSAGGTKFERRLPTMAELRAAQAARAAGKGEEGAIKAAVGVSRGTVKDPKIAKDAARKAELERIRSRASSQTQAGVRPTVASTADPKTPPAASKPAPVVRSNNINLPSAAVPKTRLDAALTGIKPGAGVPAAAAKPMAAAGAAPAAAAKPMAAAGAAPAPAPKPMARPTGARPMGARNRMRNEELDVFDTIKEYLIGEGATEEEALKQMLTLTDEQRTEILEGSCGSKKEKKSKKGGY